MRGATKLALRALDKPGVRVGHLLNAVLAGAALWSVGALLAAPAGAAELNWVIDPVAKRYLPSPAGYVVERVISVPREQGGLKAPQDLFIDHEGFLWVVDSGNGRLLKMTLDGKLVSVFGGPGGERLYQPQGVFVNADGTAYVADTGNGRVVVLGPDGQLVRAYGTPSSPLLEKGFSFKPTKLLIDNRGYINVVNEGDYRGILLLDLDGNFRGFFAANPVGFDWRRLLIRILATEAQRERIARLLPPPHSNLTQDQQGFVYTTTVHAAKGQIKRFNSIGRNTYPVREYGVPWYREFQQVLPHFTDLAVDPEGIVTVVDATTLYVFQYDQDGNNLIVFGGRGAQQGKFLYPSAIAVDARGYLYIADREQNVIQVFRPTEFMQLVHKASALYYDGRYEQAGEPWRQVLQINRNYLIAHRGLGRALLKQGKLREAMQEFRYGKDRSGYSRAFSELRYRWMRSHFGLTMLALAALLLLAWLLLKLAQRIMHSARARYGGYL